MRWPLLFVATACTRTALPAPTVTKETPVSPDLDVLFVITVVIATSSKQL